MRTRRRAGNSQGGGGLAVLVLACLALSACITAAPEPSRTRTAVPDDQAWISTAEKYLPLAEAGNARFQNLIGFMLFFGEGIRQDRAEAHEWFHRAAGQGFAPAQRNLAIMHRLGLGAQRNLAEAHVYAEAAGMTDLEALVTGGPALLVGGAAGMNALGGVGHHDLARGEAIYARFCAGCHGLNGIAAYIGSPSFALGERMAQPDRVLARSIRDGKGLMPDWGSKLRASDLADVLAFVRTLERRYDQGIAQALRDSPENYFLFGPMERDHSAYRFRS